MHIHLADASGDRGQYQLLAELMHRSSLMSFAYKNLTTEFANYWNQLVHIHFAGYPYIPQQDNEKVIPLIKSHLTTYAHQAEIKKENRHIKRL